VTFNGNEYFASNRMNPPWGMCLAEGLFDYDALDDVTPITGEEFDSIWHAHLAAHQSEWAAVKTRNPVGTKVSGFIAIFYPQGVIVELDDGALGVANYAACKASAKARLMSSKQKVTATVVRYDEDNQWLTLGSPQVHEERRQG
jgi:hypothetical protein